MHEDSVCNICKNTILAQLSAETDLIIWDEAPMQDWFAPEAGDRTLQDVLNNEKPFGGITVVFGGDFRQILPVKIKGTSVRDQSRSASISLSHFPFSFITFLLHPSFSHLSIYWTLCSPFTCFPFIFMPCYVTIT